MPQTWEQMKEWVSEGLDGDLVAGGLLGILTALEQPELLREDEDYEYGFKPMTCDLVDRMRDYSAGDFWPIYRPNEVLRKYGLDSELRIDEKEDDVDKVRGPLDGWTQADIHPSAAIDRGAVHYSVLIEGHWWY